MREILHNFAARLVLAGRFFRAAAGKGAPAFRGVEGGGRFRRGVPVLLALALAAAAPVSAQDDRYLLDEALSGAADYFSTELPEGTKVVILYMVSEYRTLAEYVIEELTMNVVNGKKLVAVGQRKLEAMEKIELPPVAEALDVKTAQSIGEALGAQVIISGSIFPLGGEYRLRIQALNTSTAQIQAMTAFSIRRDPRLGALTKDFATTEVVYTAPTIGTTSAPVAAVNTSVTSAMPVPAVPEGNAPPAIVRTIPSRRAPTPVRRRSSSMGDNYWKDRKLWVGARAGYGMSVYNVPSALDAEVATTAANSGSFEGALQVAYNLLDISASNVFDSLSLQTELDFVTSNEVKIITGDEGVGNSFNSTTLTIPLLVKLSRAVGKFHIAGLLGPSLSIPVGASMNDTESGTKTAIALSPLVSFSLGLEIGVNAGANGVLFFAPRVGFDFNYAHNTADDSAAYTRMPAAGFTLGYSYGFLGN